MKELFFAACADGDQTAIATVLSEDATWAIPGHHPLSGTKRGVAEILSFFDQLAKTGFKAEPIFFGTDDEYVVDIHRGWSSEGTGQVDTTWRSSGTSQRTARSIG